LAKPLLGKDKVGPFFGHSVITAGTKSLWA